MVVFLRLFTIMRKIIALSCFVLVTVIGRSQTCATLIEVTGLSDTMNHVFVFEHELYCSTMDTLAQPQFWKRIMTMPPDSGLINIGATREIIAVVSISDWDLQTDDEKDDYRDSVRTAHGLGEEDKVYLTTGKNDFYAFDKVLPSIDRAVQIFENEETDPFYAQAILLIESPNKLQKSSAGAYGPFQLMKSVAINHGLVVNSRVDEREDFDKSAKAAAHLIRTICIPEAKRLLDKYNLAYSEDELWFRLVVLHIYHAGAGNVSNALEEINPTDCGMDVIKTLWQTTVGAFGNASQNYSQVALASLLVLQDIYLKESTNIYLCHDIY